MSSTAGALRPIFVGGCPRSGTTLLGAMLGNGSAHLTVPEALFKFTLLPGLIDDDGQVETSIALSRLAADDFFKRWWVAPPANELPRRVPASELMDRLVQAFGQRVGKPNPSVWIDHTPGNIRYAATLSRIFPKCQFLHLVRDGRAVAASVLPLDWGPNTISDAARWWAAHIAVGLSAERALETERVFTVRYEDVVTKPDIILPEICCFLNLPYSQRMIGSREYDAASFTRTDQHLASHFPDPSRAIAWKDGISANQIEMFEHLTWETLDLLGYEMVHGPRAQMATRRERLAEFLQDVLRRGLTDRIRRRRRSEPDRS